MAGWVALSGCTREAELSLSWAPPSLADEASRIELEIHADADCGAVMQATTFRPGESPALSVPAGQVCLLARAWNDTCEAYAVGRRSIEFPISGNSIEVVLTASAASACRVDEVCRNDECLRGGAIGPIAQVQAGRHHTCIVYESGDVQCLGFNRGGEVGVEGFNGSIVRPTTISALSGFERLALGGRVFDEDGAGGIIADVPIQSGFGCGIRDGLAFCFGSNEDGQLGRGSVDREPHPIPELVDGLTDVRGIAVGGAFACALRVDGGVWCWGKNQSGVIGVSAEEAVRSLVPTPIVGLSDAIEIEAGHSHACAVTEGGRLLCWGGNYRGELGVTGVTTTFIPLEIDIDAVEEVAGGGFHTCARTSLGAVYCWGWPQRGQTGPNSTSNALPAEVIAQDAVEIDAGAKFSCARLADGRVLCWGENFYGQLGSGSVDDRFVANSTPVSVALPVAASQLSCGTHHCCAVLAGDRVACWGRGQYGRLGDGDPSNHNVGAPHIISRD